MDRHEISAEKRHLSRLPWSPFLAGAVTEVSDATDLSLVLEPIPRESFQQLIHQFGFLKLASTIATLIRAIWFIHSHGLVSRDINPGNVLVGHDGYLVMTGLGVAEREREGRSWLDMETTQYMAPELIRQGYPVGRTVGWWASGVMLYEMPHPNDGISNLTAQFTVRMFVIVVAEGVSDTICVLVPNRSRETVTIRYSTTF